MRFSEEYDPQGTPVMAINFHFAFLGRKHSYVASVTQVPSSGYAIEPSDTAWYVKCILALNMLYLED